jgi:hypothetical protein
MQGHRTAWTSRSFRRLWTASTVSTFGSEIAELALPLLALVTLSATAGEVALLRVAQFVPFLVATLPGRAAGRPARAAAPPADDRCGRRPFRAFSP